jgi:membrane protein
MNKIRDAAFTGAPSAGAPAVQPPRARFAAAMARVREIAGFALGKARRAQLGQVAASLTFSSVLALVPLLAVVLAVFTALPVFSTMRQSLEQELLKGLLPDPYAQTILRYLTQFAAKAAGLGVAGLVFLAASALSMILTVDRILNDIFQVRRQRPLARRLVVYFAVLSLGPILLGISLSLTSYVASMSVAGFGRPGAGHRQLLALAAPAITAGVYTAIYRMVPNRTVRWRDAVSGGILTALVAELMSRGFAAYVVHGGLLSIYGAFAAVPVFLMWIFLSWLVFLFGAAITATLPQLGRTRYRDLGRSGNRALTAIAVIKLLFDASADGRRRALSTAQLARALATDGERLGNMLLQLQQLGYVRRLALTDRTAEEWVLACDPQALGLGPAFHGFVIDPANSLLARNDLGLARWLQPVLSGAWLSQPLTELDQRGASLRD